MNYGMSLRRLIDGWVDNAPDIDVQGISQHPHGIREGSVLVVTETNRTFETDLRIAEANGCCAILHDESIRIPPVQVPTFVVPGLRYFLGEIAARYWAAPSDLMTIAGVAGHNRAALSHYLAQVWQRSYGKSGLFGSLGRGSMDALQPLDLVTADVFTLNETLAACVDGGIDRAAVEISAQSLREERCQTLQVDLALVMGPVGGASRRSEERRLFTEFAPTFAVVNHDDPLGRCWTNEFGGIVEVLPVGLDSQAELSARIVTIDEHGMALHLTGPWGEADVLTDLKGEHEARNLAAMAGALVLMGLDWHEVCRQIEYLRPASAAPCGQAASADRSLERAA